MTHIINLFDNKTLIKMEIQKIKNTHESQLVTYNKNINIHMNKWHELVNEQVKYAHICVTTASGVSPPRSAAAAASTAPVTPAWPSPLPSRIRMIRALNPARIAPAAERPTSAAASAAARRCAGNHGTSAEHSSNTAISHMTPTLTHLYTNIKRD